MKLVFRKSDNLSDWYLIERREHEGREWFEPPKTPRRKPVDACAAALAEWLATPAGQIAIEPMQVLSGPMSLRLREKVAAAFNAGWLAAKLHGPRREGPA